MSTKLLLRFKTSFFRKYTKILQNLGIKLFLVYIKKYCIRTCLNIVMVFQINYRNSNLFITCLPISDE